MPCLINSEFPQWPRKYPSRQVVNRRCELRCKIEIKQNEGSHPSRKARGISLTCQSLEAGGFKTRWRKIQKRPTLEYSPNRRPFALHSATVSQQIEKLESLLPRLTKLAKLSDIPLPRPLNPKNVTTGFCFFQLGNSYTLQEESSKPVGHLLLSFGGFLFMLCPSFKQRFEPQLGHDSRRDRVY